MDRGPWLATVHGVAQSWTRLSDAAAAAAAAAVESILKSRDITLPKVYLVKVKIFPVVMYRCESWTIKKAECQRIDAFRL